MKSSGNKTLSKILSIFLNIIWWIEWIGTGILLSMILVTSFLGRSISLNFPVTFSPVSFKTVPSVNKDIPPGVINVMDGNFYVAVNHTWQNVLMLVAIVIAVAAVFIVITWHLKRIFRSLCYNEAFGEDNVLRIRQIGLVLIVFAVLQFLTNIIINGFLKTHFTWDESIQLTYAFRFSYLFTGLVLIVVAQIFKEGVNLKEETNLTI